MSEPFIGEIRPMAINFVPRGWAECNGALLPIAQYTALFSIIGTTYGGDGRTTLGLPNLQDRMPMHAGRGPGLTTRRLGTPVGEPSVTLSEASMPTHSHQVGALGPANTNTPTDAGPATAPTVTQYHEPGATVGLAAGSLATTGGGEAHDNQQPFLPIRFFIALEGMYPSRS